MRGKAYAIAFVRDIEQLEEETEPEEGPGRCTNTIYEACRLHPVDCASCRHGGVCQMRPHMEAHPDKIKSCRWYEARKVRKT